MRIRLLLPLLAVLGGISVAQDQNKDTNFNTGPQYLANFGSPMFLRPISTPSLSLGAATPAAPENSAQPATVAEAEPAPASPPSPDLFRVYYGGSVEGAAEASTEPNETVAGEIELSSAKIPSTLPSSIANVGVEEILDSHSLRERRYGMDLAESAAFWKTHTPHASRVYTNADVARLHGG